MLLLAGCARTGLQAPLSAEPPVALDQKAHLLSVLTATYDACLPKGAGIKAKPPCQLAELDNFMGAGFTLSDVYCDDFFRSANQKARKRRFARGLATDAGAVVSGLLNLAKAGSDALTASTVGFSSLDSSFRNYDTSFMVDADLSKLRDLVFAAQDSMKLNVEARPPRTLYAAESTIRRYAGLCSFLGMQGLLNESLVKATAQTTAENKLKVDDAADAQTKPPVVAAVPAKPVKNPPVNPPTKPVVKDEAVAPLAQVPLTATNPPPN
jgi:hypothetical protein